MNQQEIKRGTFRPNPKGFGFVQTDTEGGFFVIPARAKGLLSGDIVSFTVESAPDKATGEEKTRAAIVAVLARPLPTILGEVRSSTVGLIEFVPDDVVLPTLAVAGLSAELVGKVICVRVDDLETSSFKPARIQSVLGRRTDAGFDTAYEICKWDIPDAKFEGEVLPSASASASAPLDNTPFVTIDGEYTKDMDDAMAVTELPFGYRLLVAIADVARFVTPGSALDEYAKLRGTTVYFHDRTLPMLPPALSEELCSLKPNVERFTLVCEADFDRQGRILRYNFSRRRIQSRARMTYDQVSGHANGARPLEPALAALIDPMLKWYRAVEPQRGRRNLVKFENVDARLGDGETGESTLIVSALDVANHLVEEAMLAANRCAAAHLLLNNQGGLFRHHQGVEMADWLETRVWFGKFGIETPAEPTLANLRAFLASLADHPMRSVFEFKMRDCLGKASYDTVRSNHYTLDFPAYAHFTSPIRRYADLVVHRLLLGEQNSDDVTPELAAQLTMKAVRANVASRDSMDRAKRRILAREVTPDAVLTGQVVNSKPTGIRVSVERWQVSSIIPKEQLEALGYSFDSAPDRKVWTRGAEVLWPGLRAQVSLGELVANGAALDFQMRWHGLLPSPATLGEVSASAAPPVVA